MQAVQQLCNILMVAEGVQPGPLLHGSLSQRLTTLGKGCLCPPFLALSALPGFCLCLINTAHRLALWIESWQELNLCSLLDGPFYCGISSLKTGSSGIPELWLRYFSDDMCVAPSYGRQPTRHTTKWALKVDATRRQQVGFALLGMIRATTL